MLEEIEEKGVEVFIFQVGVLGYSNGVLEQEVGVVGVEVIFKGLI